MRNFDMLFFLVAAAALAGAPVVEVQPGVQHASGTRVGYSPLGISFVVPPDWFGGIPPGSEEMLLDGDVWFYQPNNRCR